MISFQPLTLDDFSLLLSWLAKPHIKEWCDDGDDTLDKVTQHYGEETGTQRFLIYYQATKTAPATPIGYIQSYRAGENGIGIDLFLGDERRPEPRIWNSGVTPLYSADDRTARSRLLRD